MDKHDSRNQKRGEETKRGEKQNGEGGTFSDGEKKQELWTRMMASATNARGWKSNGESKQTGRHTSFRADRRDRRKERWTEMIAEIKKKGERNKRGENNKRGDRQVF